MPRFAAHDANKYTKRARPITFRLPRVSVSPRSVFPLVSFVFNLLYAVVFTPLSREILSSHSGLYARIVRLIRAWTKWINTEPWKTFNYQGIVAKFSSSSSIRVSRVRQDIAGIISRLFSSFLSRPLSFPSLVSPRLISPYFRAVSLHSDSLSPFARRAIEDREIPITHYRGEESFSPALVKRWTFPLFFPLNFGIFISNLSPSRNLISSEIYLSEKRRVRWISRFSERSLPL